MHSGITVSYKMIVEKVFRDFGFNYDLQDEESLEWIAEFMAHTNSGVVMKDSLEYISICDGRGDLPADLYKIKQTAEVCGVDNLEEARCGKGMLIPMRWSTDNFHTRYHKDERDYTTQSRNTYTVGQGFIFPSITSGIIALSYEAIPTDECGFPTVPGEQQWITAASYYIAYKIAMKLWLKNEMSDKAFQIIERDKEWYFAQAVNHSKQWNGVDEAESVKNAQVRTIPAMQDHASFFANMQLPEQRIFRSKNNATLTTLTNTSKNNNSSLRTQSSGNYLPIITTGIPTVIGQNTMTNSNNVVSYGSSTITNHGLCYNTSPSPNITNFVVGLGTLSTASSFSITLSGLTPNTTYYVRAFTTHSTGTSYGNEITFTTLP